MTIDDLQGGGELDALIAEKVMGWKKVYCQTIFETIRGLPPWTRWWGQKQNAEGRWRKTDLPKYSGDISAAWEVVEKLLDFRIYHGASEGGYAGGPEWTAYCRIGSLGNPFWPSGQPTNETYRGISGNAPTAPLAICRAALKAVGYES